MCRKIILLFPVFVLIATSCEKKIKDGILPGFESKLVVTSFLSPADEISRIVVTSNRPVYGELKPYPSPGKVSCRISDGEKEINLKSTEKGYEFNRQEMQVICGKTYCIQIVNEEGLSITAKCTVPMSFKNDIIIDTFSVPEEIVTRYGTERYRILNGIVKFMDQPLNENYYHIVGKVVDYFNQYYSFDVRTEDIWIENDLFTDREKIKDGMISIPVNLTGSIGSADNYIDSSFVKIYLLDTERSYFLYHKSIFDYKDDDNPFTEPTPVFSNIEGGLGIFTSYVMDSVIFRIK